MNGGRMLALRDHPESRSHKFTLRSLPYLEINCCPPKTIYCETQWWISGWSHETRQIWPDFSHYCFPYLHPLAQMTETWRRVSWKLKCTQCTECCGSSNVVVCMTISDFYIFLLDTQLYILFNNELSLIEEPSSYFK